MSEAIHSPKLRAWHLDRTAIVYVRQSTPQQVLDHQESTARQYALADRAVALGWQRERVVTIDDDLGKSGQSIEGRPGFQRLLAEVALDHVGLILGLEMSRLARCCKDWHHLLELCGRYRVLLADADGVYDPTEYSDRLLLGLHGVMNEAELHVLKQRMYQGKLNKARRGELLSTPPIGYLRVASGEWVIDPDEQVQAVVRLIFDQFDREATLHGLLRYLVHHQIRIPSPGRRSEQGATGVAPAEPGDAAEPAAPPQLCRGVSFRTPADRPAQEAARAAEHGQVGPPPRGVPGAAARPPAGVHLLGAVRDQPGAADGESQPAEHPRRPRNGPALLAGLVRCGRCGRRMMVRYSGPKRRVSYTCTRGSADYAEPLCQGLSNARTLEALVAGQLLAAVQPAALEASLAAVAGVERQRAELARQWRLRRERAAIDVDRAARQYQACEPENRLVARELERRWEEALKQQRRLDDEYARFERFAPAELSDEALSSIRALAADLPAVWAAATTTPVDRQRIARLLLERVVVTVDKASERVDVALHWVGGTVRSHAITRPVTRYCQQSDYPRLVARLRQLCTGRDNAAAIAERLNAEGFSPPKRTDRFSGEMVRRLTAHLGLARRQRHGSTAGLGPDEYRPMGLARRLGVSRDTVRRWLRVGWLNLRRDADGHHVIWADAGELRRLRELHSLPRTWANKKRLAKLKKPKPRPAR